MNYLPLLIYNGALLILCLIDCSDMSSLVSLVGFPVLLMFVGVIFNDVRRIKKSLNKEI